MCAGRPSALARHWQLLAMFSNYLINNKAGIIIDAMALGRTGTGDIDQGQGLRQGLFVERFIIR
jgi:hypothetical protein